MKRIAGAVLSLCMVLSLLPFAAYAEEPVLVKGEIGNYVVLNENCKLIDPLIVDDGEKHILDLNGYRIRSEGGIVVKNGSGLLIRDSGKGGEIVFSDGMFLTVRGFEGEVDGAFIDGSVDYSRIRSIKSLLEIEGGSVSADGSSAVEVRGCGAGLVLSGGSIVNRGEESCEPAGVRTSSEKNDGGVSVKTTGGKVTCENGPALLLQACGEYVIGGKSTEISGSPGISLFSGTLTVDGSPLVMGKEGSEENTSSGLSVISGKEGEYYGEMEVVIDGGTFISTKVQAVREVNLNPAEGFVSSGLNLFRITGGDFEGFEEDVYSENREHFISGGAFVHNPSSMITADSVCTEGESGRFKFRVMKKGESEEEEEDLPVFTDVNPEDYFYEAVVWAVENGITNGISDKLFSPYGTCTRAEAVTFLWRLSGRPVSGSNTFLDVKLSDYYHDAVTWAAESGITKGMYEGRFCPDEKVTRGQIVTFLMRYAGNCDGRRLTFSRNSGFTDVKRGDWFYEAVLWAVSEGITRGRSETLFGPDDFCTRGETVTFLQRYSD